MRVLDFSGRPPRTFPEDVLGVVRYIAPRKADGSRRPKSITEPELSDHLRAGRSVGFVFEDSTGNALDGAQQGDVDGRTAVAEMQALGVPRGVAVFAAVDTDILARDHEKVMRYLDAFHAHTWPVGYRSGVYGEYEIVARALRDGHCELGWQTVAWSTGRRAQGIPGACLLQRLDLPRLIVEGTTCDVNDIWSADWGQWGPEGDDMPIIPTYVDATPEGEVIMLMGKAVRHDQIVSVWPSDRAGAWWTKENMFGYEIAYADPPARLEVRFV